MSKYTVTFASRKFGVVTLVVDDAQDRDHALAQAKLALPQIDAVKSDGKPVTAVCKADAMTPLAVEPVQS